MTLAVILQYIVVSIHAPAKGATYSAVASMCCRLEFQSTLPRRERLNVPVILIKGLVSIHAPAKGATSDGRFPELRRFWFQSTLPRRERPGRRKSAGVRQRFQSTLPRRERLQFPGQRREIPGFNPRSREGSDAFTHIKRKSKNTFQSTLPRRERPQFQPKIHFNFQQKSTNYHFIYFISPFFIPSFFYTPLHLCTF